MGPPPTCGSAGTVCVRVALLPLLLKAQREAARTAPHLPHIQRLAQRLQDARRGAEPHKGGRGLGKGRGLKGRGLGKRAELHRGGRGLGKGAGLKGAGPREKGGAAQRWAGPRKGGGA